MVGNNVFFPCFLCKVCLAQRGQIAGGLYLDQVFQVKAESSCGAASGAYEMLAFPA